MTQSWSELASRTERNDLPYVLARAVINDAISPEEARAGILHAWAAAEWPARKVDEDVWSYVFQYANPDASQYIHGEDDSLLMPRSTLSPDMVLYRGCSITGKTGASWTASYRVAHWFAHRFGGESILADPNPEPMVFRLQVNPEWVIAKITGRSEQEFILDPFALKESAHLIETMDSSAEHSVHP